MPGTIFFLPLGSLRHRVNPFVQGADYESSGYLNKPWNSGSWGRGSDWAFSGEQKFSRGFDGWSESWEGWTWQSSSWDFPLEIWDL